MGVSDNREQNKMTEEKTEAKVDLGLLEEDDEFEEFPADSANKNLEEDKDANVWEDNWDDDTHEDDFANQLRAMKRGPDTRSPPALTPPPSKRKCLQSTPPPLATNGTSSELDLSSLQSNGVRRGGRTSQSSAGSNTSSPPGSPNRRGRGRSSTPAQPESPTPTRRSTRLRKK